MPEILHPDAELTDLFRISTGGEVFRRVRVRQRNYMKTHAEILAGSYENIVGMLIRTTTPRSQIATENIAR